MPEPMPAADVRTSAARDEAFTGPPEECSLRSAGSRRISVGVDTPTLDCTVGKPIDAVKRSYSTHSGG